MKKISQSIGDINMLRASYILPRMIQNYIRNDTSLISNTTKHKPSIYCLLLSKFRPINDPILKALMIRILGDDFFDRISFQYLWRKIFDFNFDRDLCPILPTPYIRC